MGFLLETAGTLVKSATMGGNQFINASRFCRTIDQTVSGRKEIHRLLICMVACDGCGWDSWSAEGKLFRGFPIRLRVPSGTFHRLGMMAAFRPVMNDDQIVITAFGMLQQTFEKITFAVKTDD